MKTVIANEAQKALPPAVIASLSIMGMDLATWVYLATLLYIVLQIFFILYDRTVGRDK